MTFRLITFEVLQSGGHCDCTLRPIGAVDVSSGARIRTRTVVALIKVVAALGSTLPLMSTLLVVKKLVPSRYTSWKKEPCSAVGGEIAVSVGMPEVPMEIPNVPD